MIDRIYLFQSRTYSYQYGAVTYDAFFSLVILARAQTAFVSFFALYWRFGNVRTLTVEIHRLADQWKTADPTSIIHRRAFLWNSTGETVGSVDRNSVHLRSSRRQGYLGDPKDRAKAEIDHAYQLLISGPKIAL
jgi:hypothetical protein